MYLIIKVFIGLIVSLFVLYKVLCSKRDQEVAAKEEAWKQAGLALHAEFLRMLWIAEAGNMTSKKQLTSWYMLRSDSFRRWGRVGKEGGPQCRYRLSQDEDARLQRIIGEVGVYEEYAGNIKKITETHEVLIELRRHASDAMLRVAAAITVAKLLHNLIQPKNKDRIAAELGVSRESLTAEVDELNRQQAAAWWEAGDLKSLRELKALIWRTAAGGHDGRAAFHPLSIAKVPHPDGWNDQVARLEPNPAWGDFVNVDMEPGEARRRAAGALRDKDLTEAKIVLAYCNHSSVGRTEVGDYRTAQLATFIMGREREPARKS